MCKKYLDVDCQFVKEMEVEKNIGADFDRIIEGVNFFRRTESFISS